MSNQQLPTSRPRNKAIIPLAVGGCLFLGVILLVVLSVNALRSGSAIVGQAGKGADQFLTALEKQGNQAAFDLMSSKVHKARTVKSVADVMDLLAKKYGRPVSHQQLATYDVNTFNGKTTVEMAYHETFEKRQMPVQIVLIPEGGQWRVLSFTFQP